jgi:hypothetical protein
MLTYELWLLSDKISDTASYIYGDERFVHSRAAAVELLVLLQSNSDQ